MGRRGGLGGERAKRFAGDGVPTTGSSSAAAGRRFHSLGHGPSASSALCRLLVSPLGASARGPTRQPIAHNDTYCRHENVKYIFFCESKLFLCRISTRRRPGAADRACPGKLAGGHRGRLRDMPREPKDSTNARALSFFFSAYFFFITCRFSLFVSSFGVCVLRAPIVALCGVRNTGRGPSRPALGRYR